MTTGIEELIKTFEHDLLSVDSLAVQQTLEQSLQTFGYFTTFDSIITPTLEQIGEKWEAGEVALSQVYMSGVICEEFLQANTPPPEFSSKAASVHIAIVTFKDYHVLGKRIVRAMLQAHGIDTIDYGHGIEEDELIERIKQDNVDILLLSTLMLPSARRIKRVYDAVQAFPKRPYIIVGGAPFRFDGQLWKEIGADAMGRTAVDAVTITKHFLEERL